MAARLDGWVVVNTAAPDVRQRERFVGRGRELRALKAHLAAADAGRGTLVLISGDAGIGKTRLVEEALHGVPRRRVLWGRCRAGAGAPAYWPWRQIVGGYLESAAPERVRADLGDGAPDLARLVPAVRTTLGVSPRDAIPDDEQARFRLFDAVSELLLRASVDEMLAIVLDDLHAADLESLLLLRHLGAALRGSRLLLVAAYRDVELRQAAQAARVVADLARVGHRVALDGLDADTVAAFARNVLADLPDALVTQLHDVTGGNPFFVKQVMALLHRDGWDASGRLPIPFEVRAAVRRRFDPLTPAVRWLLAQAAVLGREFELGVLAALVELSEADVLGMLGEPLALGLVGEAEAPTRFRFADALVQQTLYDDLPAADRASLHRAAAEALEAVSATSVVAPFAELAHHYHRALGRDALERAVRFSVRAAEHARELLGYEEACAHYERALAAQSTLGAPVRERLPLLLDFAEVQALAGNGDGLRATCLEAAPLAREAGDPRALARAALGYGRIPALQADDPTHVGLLEEALAALPDGDSPLRARLHARLVLATYYGAPPEERDRHACEAVAMARRLGDAATEAIALRSQYHALAGTPDPSARLAVLAEAIRVAERCGRLTVACDARIDAVGDSLELGDVPSADRALAAASELAERLRLPRSRWRTTTLQAVRALLDGDLARAEQLSERAVATAGSGADRRDVLAVHGGIVFHVRRAQGRLAELMDATRAAVGERTSPLWQAALALAEAEVGNPEAAATLVRRIAARGLAELRRDWTRLPTLAYLADACGRVAEVCGRTGVRDVALELAALLEREAPPVLVSPIACLGPNARYRGVLAHVAGELEVAVGLLEEAVALGERLGAPIEVARARLALARVLVERAAPGDAERARELADAVADTARRLALGGLASDVEALRGALARAGSRGLVSRRASSAPRVSSLPTLEVTLRREDGDWIVACGDESMRLRDTKGVRYLLRLVAVPGREIAARELFAEGERSGGSSAPAVSREALRERARELREELAEAEEFHDLGRVEALREELEELAEQLASGVVATSRDGARGGDEADAAAAERARLNVTRAILAVVRRVAQECPALGRHLQDAVRTGTLCAYRPDSAQQVVWKVVAAEVA